MAQLCKDLTKFQEIKISTAWVTKPDGVTLGSVPNPPQHTMSTYLDL